jgi:hypothetical protein
MALWIALFITVLFPSLAFGLTGGEIYENTKKTVFTVYSFDSSKADNNGMAQGSAVAVSSKLVVTNCHVLQGLKVILSQDDKKYLGILARGDRDKDICILYVPESNLDYPPIRESLTLKIGETVYALGSPQQEEAIFTKGLISGIKGDEKRQKIIFIDANIDFGSSGGGLFDENGSLIGLTTGKKSNINYAIPVDWVKETVENLRFNEPTQSSNVAQQTNNVKIKFIGDFGEDKVNLYAVNDTCFIKFNGINREGRVVGSALWLPILPNVVLFSAATKPLEETMQDLATLTSSEKEKIVRNETKSNFHIPDVKTEMMLIKSSNMENFLLAGFSEIPLVTEFIAIDYFSANFFSGNHPKPLEITYGARGFHAAYKQYLSLCPQKH